MVIETGKPIAEVARDLGIVFVSQDDRSRPRWRPPSDSPVRRLGARWQTSHPADQPETDPTTGGNHHGLRGTRRAAGGCRGPPPGATTGQPGTDRRWQPRTSQSERR